MPNPKRTYRRSIRAARRIGVPAWLAAEAVRESALRAIVDARRAGVADVSWLAGILALADADLIKYDALADDSEVTEDGRNQCDEASRPEAS